MYNILLNWTKIIKENLPFHLQSTLLMDWIKALISPFNKIHQEFLVQYQVYIYKIGFNGQVNYLQKILNDKFDPVSNAIYITDALPFSFIYLYQKIELKPPKYAHRKWNSTISYSINNYATDNNKLYKALTANSNKKPSLNPSDWLYIKDVKFLRMRNEFTIQYNFIVNVPSSLVFDLNAMKAIIDYYRLAGCRYKIVTF